MSTNTLDEVRDRIAATDRQIVELIATRLELARQAGRIKRAQGAPTLDPAREAAVLTRATEYARSIGLPEEDVRDVFWHVIGMCRRAQAGEE